MVNRLQLNDMRHGQSFELSMINHTSLGCVRGISMKSQDKKKRWEEQFVHIVKCKLSRKSLTNADLWIWVSLGQISHGAKII